MVHSNITVITSTNIFNDMPEMWIRLWKLLLNFGRVLVGNNIEKWFSHLNMLTVCLIWWFWKLQFNKEINFIENIQSKEFHFNHSDLASFEIIYCLFKLFLWLFYYVAFCIRKVHYEWMFDFYCFLCPWNKWFRKCHDFYHHFI